MNQFLIAMGWEAGKPMLTALLLPPMPFVLLVLVGARLLQRRRAVAWVLLLLGASGVWLGATQAAGAHLTRWLLQPPAALGAAARAALTGAPGTAIVVLGGGRWLLAPEYAHSSLMQRSVERLRYGIWLARQTQLPLAFSGGVGLGSPPGPTEAEIAAGIAEQEFGFKLRWLEGASRDTGENANNTLALLRPQGIKRIVLVTHDYHMARAMANFERAAAALGGGVAVVAAPVGLRSDSALRAIDWLPSSEGFESTRLALREWLGRRVGA